MSIRREPGCVRTTALPEPDTATYTSREDKALALVLKDLEDASSWHGNFCTRAEKSYNAYRGIPEERAKSKTWTSKLHPHYGLMIAETIVANLSDDKLAFSGRARPRVLKDLAQLTLLQEAATAQEYLLNAQLDRMRFLEKQRPFYLQNVIVGASGLKDYWKTKTRDTKQRVQRTVPMFDDNGQVIGSRVIQEVEKQNMILYDDPYGEIVDMRDFWWNPGGVTEFDRAESCTHRVYMTWDELEEQAAAGYFKNLKKVKETRSELGSPGERSATLFMPDKAKGMVEVLERWSKDRHICVANRSVVLCDEEMPYWHGALPFTIFSTRSELFSIYGISEIQTVADLQEALWSLGNQRLDNVELLNNAVTFINPLVDRKKIEIAPGAINQVEGDPNQAVMVWSPTPLSAQISLPAEDALRQDIQTISGAAPVLGSQAQAQETATATSILTTIAQKILATKKQIGYLALTRFIDHMCWLNRQFIQEDRLVELIGAEGAMAYRQVTPKHLAPDVQFDFEPAAESLIRSERRAESQALLQVGLEAAQMATMMGEPINIPELFRRHLKAFNIDDVERFFLPPDQTLQLRGMLGLQTPTLGTPQNGGGLPMPPTNGGPAPPAGGVGPMQTSPLATGTLQPSTPGISMSPVEPQARMYSMTGRMQ